MAWMHPHPCTERHTNTVLNVCSTTVLSHGHTWIQSVLQLHINSKFKPTLSETLSQNSGHIPFIPAFRGRGRKISGSKAPSPTQNSRSTWALQKPVSNKIKSQLFANFSVRLLLSKIYQYNSQRFVWYVNSSCLYTQNWPNKRHNSKSIIVTLKFTLKREIWIT